LKSLLSFIRTVIRFSILTALAVLQNHVVSAQQLDCGTGPAPASHLSYLESLVPFYPAQTEDTNWIHLPVTAHAVRSSSGFGGMTETAIYATICNLNERFASGRISFYLSERVRFINNTAYYGATSYGPLGTMIDQENIARTINIYYTDLSGMGLCGFAYYPLSGPGGFQNDGAIVMSFGCSQPTGTTLAHEMGHYLSLPHTFNQTSSNPLDPNDAERVTRNFNEIAPRLSANCFTAGDRFCDTPSDFIAGRWSCPSSRTTLDLNNDAMKPDSSFYMSYSYDNCMSRFSEQQMTAMRATVNSTNAPRGYLTLNPYPNFPAITTYPAKFFPQITDTVVPNNALFRWAPINGASLYQIKIFQFNVNVFDTLVEDTFYHALGNRLRGMRQYSWIVRGINGGNLCTPFSPRDSFSTSTYVFAGINDALSAKKPLVYPTALGTGDLLTLEGLQAGSPIVLTLRDPLGRAVWTLQEFNEDEGRLLAFPGDLPFGHYLLTCSQSGRGFTYRLFLKP